MHSKLLDEDWIPLYFFHILRISSIHQGYSFLLRCSIIDKFLGIPCDMYSVFLYKNFTDEVLLLSWFCRTRFLWVSETDQSSEKSCSRSDRDVGQIPSYFFQDKDSSHCHIDPSDLHMQTITTYYSQLQSVTEINYVKICKLNMVSLHVNTHR